MNLDHLLALLIDQAIEVIQESAPSESPLIENLRDAKLKLENINLVNQSLDPRKAYLNQLIGDIAKEKESLVNSFDGGFDDIQELFRLGIIEAWLYDTLYLLDYPHPSP